MYVCTDSISMHYPHYSSYSYHHAVKFSGTTFCGLQHQWVWWLGLGRISSSLLLGQCNHQLGVGTGETTTQTIFLLF
jgi:hypothetical protein